MAKSQKWYDDFYKKQPVNFLDHRPRHTLTASLCRGKIADIGCCMGILSDYYFGDYTGFDFSKVALDKGREIRRSNARLILHDCSDLSGIDIENFDTFVMSEFLEHFENDDKILEPIFARAKPGARIIVSVPNGDRIPDAAHMRTLTIPELRKRFSPHGRVKFYNWEGAKLQILMTIDLGQKNDNLISLVMPVKNEEVGLENAVLSCVEFVDNIVISVDNSSTDKTREVAKMYADILKDYTWNNSFCQARNFAQEGVKTKWVLALDGHEFVESFPDLEKYLNDKADGLEIQIVLENGFKFHFPRIIKSFVKWQADVHNYPAIKSRSFYKGFLIRHDRDNLQAKDAVKIRDEQRRKMVVGIMTKELEKDKKAIRPLFYLAQQHFVQKDFRKSIKFYNKYLKYSTHKGERWLACYDIASARIFLNHKLRALWALDRADKEIPGRWEIEKLRGSAWTIIGNYEKAVKHFVQSFSEQVGNFTYCPVERDDAQTWDFIGHALYALKKISEAKIAWNRSLELEKAKPKNQQNENRLKIIERMLKF